MTETTPDYAELIEWLEGVYRVPITDGLGAVGAGEEPDNPDMFVRKFETPPIQKEAATALRTLLERNKELERERDEARRQSDRFCDKYLAALSRAEAAEAERDRLKERVAELEKALEPFAREAEDWSPEANGGLVFDDAESIAGATSITVGHLRTARAYRDKRSKQ